MANRLLGDDLQPFEAFLQDFCDAYEAMDTDRLGQFISRDAVHCIGTGIDEVLTNHGSMIYALQRDFDELSAIKIYREDALSALEINGSVCLSWNLAVEYTQIATPETVILMPPLRFSMVLERQEQKWRIVHAHISTPLPDEDNRRSFPQI